MRLSPNFTLIEMACKCGCGGEQAPAIVANLMRVAAMLEKVRAVCGKPLHVTSGFRCAKHNAKVGGADGSRHLTGEAADVVCYDLAPVRVQRIARGIPEVHGLGLGKTFTHLDVRGRRVEFPY